MKLLKYLYTLLCIGLSLNCESQLLDQANPIFFEVSSAFSKKVTDGQLSKAVHLKDLYEGYPASWIAEDKYISTSLTINDHSPVINKINQGGRLSAEQKKALREAPIGSVISAIITYEEEERQGHQVIKLSTVIVPELEARYMEGTLSMHTYVQHEIIDILNAAGVDFQEARLSFLISDEGVIKEISMIKSTEDKKLDNFLINTIKAMNSWTPAFDKEGLPVAQRFELRLGAIYGC